MAYSEKLNQELEFRTLDVLLHSDDAMTIQQIQQQDMILAPHTPQKLARVLGKLIEMGLVKKSKSKSTNRMLYKSVAVMIAQGYDIGNENEVPATVSMENIMPVVPNWELTTERMSE